MDKPTFEQKISRLTALDSKKLSHTVQMTSSEVYSLEMMKEKVANRTVTFKKELRKLLDSLE